jgi:hypothetical protein
MVAIIGLSVDWGKAALNVHQLHNGADASALAGAQVVKFNQVRARDLAIALAKGNAAEGQEIAVERNEDNLATGELVLGRWVRQERKFYPTLDTPNAVKVVGVRAGQRTDAPHLKLVFGGIFGTSEISASRHAIAMSTGSTGAGIICLASDPTIYDEWTHDMTVFLIDGGPTIDLRGTNPETGEEMTGDVQINGISTVDPKQAFRTDGTSAEIWAGEFNVVGSTRPGPDDTQKWASLYADSTLPFSVNPGAPTVIDPLQDVPEPDPATMVQQTTQTLTKQVLDTEPTGVTKTVNATTGATEYILQPGYYAGGISITGSADTANIVLTPGAEAEYAFGGVGLDMSGGGSITGLGVMIYVTGDEAHINIGGTTYTNLLSRGDAGYIRDEDGQPALSGEAGIVIFQDRENDNLVKLCGTPDSLIKGCIYAGYAPVEIGGQAGNAETASQMGNQIIAGALDVHGNIKLGVAYDGRNTIEAYRSILVE